MAIMAVLLDVGAYVANGRYYLGLGVNKHWVLLDLFTTA